MEVVDLSSSKPHVRADCPSCGFVWHMKAENGKHVTECECELDYKITIIENGVVNIYFEMSIDKAKELGLYAEP